ncbi:unnamed protein product [Ilex paraguariensis]|uniref:Homeobox domain-containing protein n=1 Tax=Ilex paraguariensis TaxID=185542 RepID=A0ABC8UG51_9AQUA
MAENNVFNMSMDMDMDSQNPIVTDGIFAHMRSVSLAHTDSLDLNNQNHIIKGFPLPAMLQGEPINNLHACLHLPNHPRIADSDAFALENTQLQRGALRDPSIGSSCPINDIESQVQLMTGIPISTTSDATLLASPFAYDCSNTINSSFGTSVNSGYDGTLGNMSSHWDLDKFMAPSELARIVPVRAGFQPLQSMGNIDPNGWISSENTSVNSDGPGSSRFGNELSLSLATCQPSVICASTIQDQCSDLSCSVVTNHSCGSKNLSSSIGSYSQLVSGSRYLHVMQEILAAIASYSLENLDQMSYPANGGGAGASFSFSSSLPAGRGCSVLGSGDFFDDGRVEGQIDSMFQGRQVVAKKKHLLALLQMVDDRCSQCLDEIHTVISAFHSVTELDPHIHARFSLQTISFLYKDLKERISNYILAMGACFNKGGIREDEASFETSFIQKQWALQQLRRKDHQLWRPQRGLPERSVSVLRAWMFENFLHPYPKDAEKHLLAVKSGLTRSQVSNWFINARVRLWKPMIEEMYAEMNRRKGRRMDEETNSNRRNQLSIVNRRF